MAANHCSGLSGQEAQALLRQYGPNVIESPRQRPFYALLLRFWAPVPWMLELALVLEMVLGKWPEAAIIGLLLLFNGMLGFSQERRAQVALELLRERLHIQSRVCRDGRWMTLPAAGLVPGDLVYLRMGDIAPADLRILSGQLLVDESALTGESLPVEREADGSVYSASIIRRGEASAHVVATGGRSYFGKTAELVRTAGAKSHLEMLVLSIVRYLVAMDVILVAAILVAAVWTSTPLGEILPFALILLVASVPVALPATFTLATAMSSMHLTRQGILVTRLAAIEEAAAMSDLCSDKTGTLTQNRLDLSGVRSFMDPPDEGHILAMAALASDSATQDPIDLAILAAVAERSPPLPERTDFVPFDPATKRSEAEFVCHGESWKVMKGAPGVIAGLCQTVGNSWEKEVEDLAATGARVLAVAAGPADRIALLGLLALADPLRGDAVDLVRRLESMGIQVRMVSGDAPATASHVAEALGLKGRTCGRSALQEDCGVYAGVFPEDKFHLVQNLQKRGRIVGMTGDGVNDAPALRQAEMGVAVQNATDVAKAAASLVLMQPGLQGVVTAVETGRRVYQRMLTYTLNKIVKVFQVALFLGLGFLFFHRFVVSPLQVLLLLFANDFVTMSLAGDHVRPSPRPDRWDIRALVGASLVVAIAWLIYIFLVYGAGQVMRLGHPACQSLDFLGLVFSGLANVFLVRERGHLWASRPGRFLVLATVVDIAVVSLMAWAGWLMAMLPVGAILGLLLVTLMYTLLLDQIKVPVLRYLQVA